MSSAISSIAPNVVHEAVDERQHVRSKLPARVVLSGADDSFACELQDISLGGLGLRCSRELPQGALYDAAMEARKPWRAELDKAVQAIRKEDYAAETMAAFLAAGRKEGEAVVKTMGALRSYQVEHANAAFQAAQKRYELALWIFALALFKPQSVPALPPEARTFREPSGSSGYTSLTVLMLISTLAAVFLAEHMEAVHSWWQGELVEFVPTDEKIVVAMCGGSFLAWLIAALNKVTRLGLLSKLAERVTFVLIPPLLLIFLVLGTIFLGVATPTEGGAMGAVGALIMATLRRRLDLPLLKQALNTTTKLSSFVMFILVGATIFSMVFQAADGPVWVEHLLAKLPGGQLGFLIFVNVMIFVLAFFLDFFELSFIVVPVLAPIADKMGIDLVWFGVLLAINMQTSFMHPPFGFALFYLRSVAPDKPYVDSHTGKTMEPVTTMQIYKGAIPFLVLQLSMVAILIAFPGLVTSNLDKQVNVDMKAVGEQMLEQLNEEEAEPELDLGIGSPDTAAPADTGSALPEPGATEGAPAAPEDDPVKALEQSVGKP